MHKVIFQNFFTATPENVLPEEIFGATKTFKNLIEFVLYCIQVFK